MFAHVINLLAYFPLIFLTRQWLLISSVLFSGIFAALSFGLLTITFVLRVYLLVVLYEQRLLVLGLLSLNYEEGGTEDNLLSWFHELYPGEFDYLKRINMLSDDNGQPLPPRIKDWESGGPLPDLSKHPPTREILQVYICHKPV